MYVCLYEREFHSVAALSNALKAKHAMSTYAFEYYVLLIRVWIENNLFIVVIMVISINVMSR